MSIATGEGEPAAPKDASLATDTHEKELRRTGPIQHAEAREILRRYNASHFRNHSDLGERARYSIPADPRRDDDIRLSAYITQSEAETKALDRAVELLGIALDHLDEHAAALEDDGAPYGGVVADAKAIREFLEARVAATAAAGRGMRG